VAAPLPKKSPKPTLLLPEHNSKMKKITKSKLKAIIKEEIQNVVGSLQEEESVERIRRNNAEYVGAVVAITDAVLAGSLGEPSGDAGRLKQMNQSFKNSLESGQTLSFRGGHDRHAIKFISALKKAAPEALKKLGLPESGIKGANVRMAAKRLNKPKAAAPAAPEKKKGFLGRMFGD
jgi:hypothetical protein